MLYNIVLVSAIHQHESAIGIYMSSPLEPPFHFPPYPTPLGCHRTLAWVPWAIQQIPIGQDEMAGWHHLLDGHEFEWTPVDGDGQGGLACCDSWGRKELDMTERLNWTEGNWPTWHTVVCMFPCYLFFPFNCGHPNGCEVLSHCGFDLRFSNDWASYHMLVGSSRIFREVSVQVLCPFFCLFVFSCRAAGVLYIFWEQSFIWYAVCSSSLPFCRLPSL